MSLSLVIALPFLLAASAAPAEFLQNGSSVTATLGGGVRRHSLSLDRGNAVLVRVDQQGVDVAVTTVLPDGRPSAVVDSPNGAYGPEWVSFEADVAGVYTLEVRAIEANTAAGTYQVHVIAVVPHPETPEQRMDWDLARYSAPDGPGVAVSIVRDGVSVYRKGFGMADLEHDVPVTPTSVFDVASVSKQFTAFALLLLAADGDLSLEDDAHRYLPELAIDRPITLRQLVQHTSGLRDLDELLRLSGVEEQAAVTNEEVVALLCRQRGLNFEPGTAFEYSNSGFVLAAEVVARVSGQSFSRFTSERIFAPLGMSSTRFVDDPASVVRNRAWSYGSAEGGTVLRPINHGIVGSTGLHTTVDDLSRWARNFEVPVLGDRALFAELERPGALASGEALTYGLGLDRKVYRGQEVLFHGGGEAGYRAYLVRVPAHGFSIAVASNAGALNPVEVANQAMDHFLLSDAPVDEPERRKRVRATAIEGDYELFPGQILTISRDREGVWLRGNHDDAPVRLEPVSERTFLLGDAFRRVSFPPAPDGAPRTLRYHIYDFTWTGREVVLRPVEPASEPYGELIGRYHSIELGVDLTVAEVDGGLVVRGHRFGDLVMTPFQPDTFTTDTGYLSQISVARSADGVVTGLKISGTRARGIGFDRVP